MRRMQLIAAGLMLAATTSDAGTPAATIGDGMVVGSKLKPYEYTWRQCSFADGKWVSTVWLGLDHGFHGGKPIIFETMVFDKEGTGEDLDQDRYTTEQQAREGHAAMVKKWEGM